MSIFSSFSDELIKIANQGPANPARPNPSAIEASKILLDHKGLDLRAIYGGKLPDNISLSTFIGKARDTMSSAGMHDVVTNTPKDTNLQGLLDKARDLSGELSSANTESHKAYLSGAMNGTSHLINNRIGADKYKTMAVIGGMLGGSAAINYAVKKYRQKKKTEELGK